MLPLSWYLAMSVGLCLFVLADLISHRTWHVAVLVLALVAFAACTALAVYAIPVS